jgi:glucose/arabinose dehydrogenase
VIAGVLAAACGGDQPGGQTDADTSQAASATASTCEPGNGGLLLPQGFCAVIVADELGRARHLAVAENGDIYVRMRNDSLGGGIVALRDTTGDGRADIIERFRNDGGTGIEIRNGVLWFSTDTSIYRVALPTDGSLLPTAEPELVVSGFPAQRSHSSKPFTFDGAGGLYVTVGSPTNACQPQDTDRMPGPGQDPCPEYPRQSGVWRFDANRAGQTQRADGQAYAVGIRNAMSIAWNDGVNALYIVQHGRDVLNVTGPDHFTLEQNATKPGELMYRLAAGDTLHHPYCFWDLDQQQAVLAPEYGGDGQEVGRCGAFKEPLTAYPAHWAPNDIVFYTGTRFPERYRNGAFIAFHGSWNRAPLPMQGYLIAFQPMNVGEPAGNYEIFADNFKGAPEIAGPGDAAHRPTGLAIGPDGSLYVSDSLHGRIWRIIPAGE